MYLVKVIIKHMNELLKKLLNEYDTVVIGAGSGLSSAAGFEYGGSTFMDNFKYMYDLYGYTDMYSAGFHDFDTLEEKWAFWSKMVYLNRYKDGAKQLYKYLYDLVKDKDYFVITSNVDHQFQLSGFDKKRLFYMQGDYGLFQCSIPCHNKTYDNKEQIIEMMKSIRDNKIESSLIPRCPICNHPMELNLRCDDSFVEDDGWRDGKNRYNKFIEQHKDKKVLYLEIGVGYSTPTWIKFPFMQYTYKNKNAMYVIINNENQIIPKEIEDKTIIIKGDIKSIISN